MTILNHPQRARARARARSLLRDPDPESGKGKGTGKGTLVLVLAVAVSGCALTSKSDALQVRYFTPESSAGSSRAQTAVPAAVEPLGLMLGRVRASSYLRERIAFRPSAHELGFYETRRWTERPESYLRRALSASLFEQRGVEPVLAGPGATLDVELIAFEETRKPVRTARLQATYLLYGGGLPSIERTITVERAIAPNADPTLGIVQALSAALDEGVARISDDVVARLQADATRTRDEAEARALPTPQ
jgi:cholesterol transport system auxiliary component